MKPMPQPNPHRRTAGTVLAQTLLAVSLLAVSLLAVSTSRAADPLPVFVSIPPLAGFVAEIGGDQVTVAVLVGPGHSPATYEPTPRQMAGLSGAAIFFAAGVPFERGLLPRVAALPSGPRVAAFGPHVAAATAGAAPAQEDGQDGDQDDGRGHAHGHDHAADIDPHAWLDPLQAAAFADTVCAWLGALRPESAAAFAARRDALQARLADLDREVAAKLAPFRGREFFVFHPAYGHFAGRYGLVQVAVEEGGREPGARQLAAVIERARAAGARAIVVQPQFSQRSAGTVARGTGAEILVLDPLAADYEANLRRIAAALAAALGQ